MSDIKKLIKEKIEQIHAVSKDLPSVIIIHDMKTVLYMSDWGLRILGITQDELLAMGSDYFTRFFHPEDKELVKGIEMLVTVNKTENVITLVQRVKEYRGPNKKGEWGLYFTSSKILLQNDNYEPVLIIACAHPINPDNSLTDKMNRIIEENSFTLHKKHLFESLSGREKEILKLIARSVTNEKIAERLHLSVETVKTHRKNLKKKLGIRSNHELQDYAKAFDLV